MLPMSPSLDFDTVRTDVQAAQGVALEAASLRRTLRRRFNRDDPRRIERLTAMLELIDKAMKPIRSHSGRLAWEAFPDDLDQTLPEASSVLQYERRQLKKMLP